MNVGSNIGADRLRSIVERWERLEEEVKELRSDQKDIFTEASSAGYDVKTIRRIIRKRRLTQSEREEEDALDDIYMAALGMLDGTPLGDAARKRLNNPPNPSSPPATSVIEDPGAPLPFSGSLESDAQSAAPLPPSAEDIASARDDGATSAHAGKRVTDNPHPAGDPRRGAWDEGWCAASGSDGMDIPAAWRRAKPAKKPPGGE